MLDLQKSHVIGIYHVIVTPKPTSPFLRDLNIDTEP
jgi:hypothetical protein